MFNYILTMENKNKFESYKKDILLSLNEKMKKGEIKIQEKVTLVDGFFMQNFQETLQGIQLGGRAIPSIALIGESGQIYFLAIKVILPNIQI